MVQTIILIVLSLTLAGVIVFLFVQSRKSKDLIESMAMRKDDKLTNILSRKIHDNNKILSESLSRIIEKVVIAERKENQARYEDLRKTDSDNRELVKRLGEIIEKRLDDITEKTQSQIEDIKRSKAEELKKLADYNNITIKNIAGVIEQKINNEKERTQVQIERLIAVDKATQDILNQLSSLMEQSNNISREKIKNESDELNTIYKDSVKISRDLSEIFEQSAPPEVQEISVESEEPQQKLEKVELSSYLTDIVDEKAKDEKRRLQKLEESKTKDVLKDVKIPIPELELVEEIEEVAAPPKIESKPIFTAPKTGLPEEEKIETQKQTPPEDKPRDRLIVSKPLSEKKKTEEQPADSPDFVKQQLLPILSKYREEWKRERMNTQDTTSLTGGQNILNHFISELRIFRNQYSETMGQESISKLNTVIRDSEDMCSYVPYKESDYEDFWKTGESLIEDLNSVANELKIDKSALKKGSKSSSKGFFNNMFRKNQ